MHWTLGTEAAIEYLFKLRQVTYLERQEGGGGEVGVYVCGRKEDAEFRNCAALGSGQTPTSFIHYYYFYGKRNLQQFRLCYLPSGIGPSKADSLPVWHRGCSWVVRGCACVCMLRHWHVPLSVCVRGAGVQGCHPRTYVLLLTSAQPP